MSEEQAAEKEPEPTTKARIGRRAALSFAVLYWAILVFLTFMYLFVGDAFAFGELITIWPAALWVFGLLPMCLTLKFVRNTKSALIAFSGLFLFLLVTEEWLPLFRVVSDQSVQRYETVRAVSSEEVTALRLLVWNVDGKDTKQLLPALESHAPDVCFLQETADGSSSIQEADLTGYWEGFHWIDAGDCGILSRFPIKQIESASVGPWSAPLMVEMETPNEQTTLLVNVRLMLPNLSLDYFSPQRRAAFISAHRARIDQYRQLAEQIDRHNYTTTVLAGDFNVPATACSLKSLRGILRDVWLECGHGWGRTTLASFPLARIDQCWVSKKVECIRGETARGPFSDHKLLLMDVIL